VVDVALHRAAPTGRALSRVGLEGPLRATKTGRSKSWRNRPSLFKGSRIELDGRDAPPLSVFQYTNLPPGLYEVSAFLIGTSGQRAAVSKIVKVVSRTGS
jgi:hypothetical protein